MRKFIVLAILALVCSSCTQTFYIGRFPQSHFTYPNANVTPLNKVRGVSATRAKLFIAPSVTSRIQSEAYSSALAQSQGANLIINVDAYHKVTFIPLYVINLYLSRYIVEGTAAKQEVGRQQLSR
jgi:hypothetical protein